MILWGNPKLVWNTSLELLNLRSNLPANIFKNLVSGGHFLRQHLPARLKGVRVRLIAKYLRRFSGKGLLIDRVISFSSLNHVFIRVSVSAYISNLSNPVCLEQEILVCSHKRNADGTRIILKLAVLGAYFLDVLCFFWPCVTDDHRSTVITTLASTGE